MEFFATSLKLMGTALVCMLALSLLRYTWVTATHQTLAPRKSRLPQLSLPWQTSHQLALKVMAFALAIRLLTYFVTFIGFAVVTTNNNGFLATFQEIWHRWDTDSFLFIAEHWYVAEGNDRFRLAFYPMYPLLIKTINPLINNYFYAGIVVSLASYCLASLYLFKLVLREFNHEQTAWNAVKYMAIFPLAFFFGTVYTESTFLLFCLACIYHLRKQQWLLAGLFMAAASLTRNQGVLLAVAIIAQGLACYPIWHRAEKRLTLSKDLAWPVLSITLGAFGFVIYLLINKVVTGEYFMFLKYQEQNWNNHFSFFANNISEMLMRGVNSGHPGKLFGTWLPSVIAFFVVVFSLLVARRKMPLPILAFGFCMLIISYSPSWLLSGARYTLVIFPMFIGLALWTKNRPNRDQLLTISSVLLLAIYAMVWTRSFVY